MKMTYQTDRGILQVEPTGKLQDKEFEALSTEIQAISEKQETLNGVLISTREFPGYQKVSDLLAHAQFIQEQQHQIPKVALCTDSPVGHFLEWIGKTLPDTEARTFRFDEKKEAEAWLLS